jgi:thioredoxin-related protein
MRSIKYLMMVAVVSTILLADIAKSQDSASAEPVTLKQALNLAPETGKKILVDVYATWCPYCQRMHSEVYPSEKVSEAISEHFLLVRIDVEGSNEVNYFGEIMTEAEFARALDNKNVPTTYFLNQEGAILGVQPGYLEPDVFSSLLQFVGSDAYLNQSFNEFNQSD